MPSKGRPGASIPSADSRRLGVTSFSKQADGRFSIPATELIGGSNGGSANTSRGDSRMLAFGRHRNPGKANRVAGKAALEKRPREATSGSPLDRQGRSQVRVGLGYGLVSRCEAVEMVHHCGSN